MSNKIILTIGRQFGSGGREVGKKLATELGIGYYDKELMAIAARESGLAEDFFAKADEQTSNRMAYALNTGYTYMGGGYMPYANILSNDGLFKIQSDAIRNLADTESCVIVGRCADYILRDDPALISLFIHDTRESRIRRVMVGENVSEEVAKEQMVKTDKSRAAYYNYYTNKTWGASASYHFSINLSLLGVDESVAFIKDLVERKRNLRPPHFG